MQKKKAQFSRGRSHYTVIYTHAHSLAHRDLSGNKKRFCLATDTIKVLSSSDWTSARSPGHVQNAARTPAPHQLHGHVCVRDCGRRRRGRMPESWEIQNSVTQGWVEGPRRQQLPSFWWYKTTKKGFLQATQPAAGEEGAHQSSERSPLFLSLPACTMLFVQPGRITGNTTQTTLV